MSSIRGWSLVVVIALAASIAIDLLSIASFWSLLGFLDRAESGDVTQEEGEAIDSRHVVLGLFEIGLLLVCAAVFIVWLYRAHSNLRRSGRTRLSYGSGWAIGGWFVPILNLFRPYQIVRETWDGSIAASSHLSGRELARSSGGSGALVVLWWVGFLAMGVLGNAAGSLLDRADRIPELKTAATVTIASGLLDSVVAVLAILIVRRVTELQEAARVRGVAEVFA